MNTMMPELHYHGGTLIAIPAVHCRAVFANQVNFACTNGRDCPAAVAVELGASAVAAVSAWFKELEMEKEGSRLPIMLGLVRRNRRIHPRFKKKAIRLQQMYGRPIHEIPLPVLREELGYAGVSLLCLSPIDSIIEAIRCALELDIPVYGIDLEESASTENLPVLIEDPLKAQADPSGYILRNQQPAGKCRDTQIDGRRERVMAARLKLLLERHKRVLFTGGLGHWFEIQRHMQDRLPAPAAHLPLGETVEHLRVLVDPAMAAFQMDIFPSVAACYERQRRPAFRRSRVANSIDFAKLLRSQLDAAYADYFTEQGTSAQSPESIDKLTDWERLPSFELFLGGLCATTQRQLPNIGILLEAAKSMMSNRFLNALEQSLLRHEIAWAEPGNFPHLPILGPAPKVGDGPSPLAKEKVRLGIPRERREDNGVTYDYHAPFYISLALTDADQLLPVELPEFFEEIPARSDKETTSCGRIWIWPPCEFFLHGTAFAAAEIVRSDSSGRKVTPFEGSIFDGIDVKATLRAKIRDEDTIYVHSTQRHSVEDFAVAQGKSLDPTVFIFADPSEPCAGHWELGAAGGNEIRDHVTVKDLARHDEIVKNFGAVFICSVQFSVTCQTPDNLRHAVQSVRELQGTLTFGNPCVNVKQSALWLEASRYAACPILRTMQMDELLDFYRQHHEMTINHADWNTALIRFAIPYAGNRVVIVAHENFVIDPLVQKEAERRKIRLEVVSLSLFPAERIRHARQQYLVEVKNGGLGIERELELRLGPKDNYLEMLPMPMRKQVLTNR